MTSSSIRDFMIQYKQGLDAGDIEYKDAEFERVAEIFKRYAYLPRYVDISEFADLTKTVTDFFTDFYEERPELWKYAEDTIDKEDLAMLEYYDFNAKKAKEYLKRNVKRFAMRLIQNKDEERLAKLLKMNIASKQLLKLLLEETGEVMPTARAYILEMLGNTKTNKSFSI